MRTAMAVVSICVALAASALCDALPTVRIEADAKAIGMGRSVIVSAKAILPGGQPAVGWQLLPYVNDARWGSHEFTDENGEARFILPLPTPGVKRIQVLARKIERSPLEHWIWDTRQGVPGPVYLQRAFTLPDKPESASLWVAVDDIATVFLNGTKVADKGGWHENRPVALPLDLLRVGENVLSARAENGTGPCGLLVRLEVNTAQGGLRVSSDTSWRAFAEEPPGWPGSEASGGEAAVTYGDANTGVVIPEPWPGLDRTAIMVGSPRIEGAAESNPLVVDVRARKLETPPADPRTVIIAQWEPWFTPRNATWTTGPGVPLMGLYWSSNPDVARQHLIWFMESGVDALLADWSNHIWFSKSWKEIGPGSWELINNTTLMMDVMAQMREEGHPVPKMTLLSGISHVRPEGPTAVREQLAFIWDTYIANPKYEGLWVELDGKPLVEILDLGASYVKENIPLDDRFAIRFVGVSQDVNGTDQYGLWTWMDWKRPVPTMRDGIAEAMTASIGSFGGEGWMGRESRGHRWGATLAEDWVHALRERPRFLHLHQFNEFAGQPEGQGHGPDRDRYYDSYSAEFSDDFEPTSLTAPAYRCDGGWGFYYLNLVRALVDLYRRPEPDTTVVVLTSPTAERPGHSMIPVVRDDDLRLKWMTVGRPATGFTILVNDRVVACNVRRDREKVSLRGIPDGLVRVKVIAEGTRSRYRLSYTEDSLPLENLEPAWMEATFQLERDGGS